MPKGLQKSYMSRLGELEGLYCKYQLHKEEYMTEE